jgi:hypothetical protein
MQTWEVDDANMENAAGNQNLATMNANEQTVVEFPAQKDCAPQVTSAQDEQLTNDVNDVVAADKLAQAGNWPAAATDVSAASSITHTIQLALGLLGTI